MISRIKILYSGVTDFDRTQSLYRMTSCDQQLPDIDIDINGNTFSIPVEHYKFDVSLTPCSRDDVCFKPGIYLAMKKI